MGFDITSPANERIKRLVRLRDRTHRDAEGVFVVEGPRLLYRAVDAGLTPVEVYSDGSVDVPGVTTVTVDPIALDRASYRSRSNGVIAVFEQFSSELEDIELGPNALLLVAEGVEKPGNLGAILRTADAVAATAVVVLGAGVDVFNPNTLRASTGAVFTVPVVTAGLDRLVSWLKVPLLAASPEGDRLLWDTDLAAGVALMVGAEDEGLSDAAKDAATTLVSIPMLGATDSLNTSVTMALMAYEAVRQRKSPGR